MSPGPAGAGRFLSLQGLVPGALVLFGWLTLVSLGAFFSLKRLGTGVPWAFEKANEYLHPLLGECFPYYNLSGSY